MTEEIVLSDIEKTNKAIKDLIRSCPRYLQRHFDDCQDHCIVVSLCWSLQDDDTELAEDMKKTLEEGENG